MFLYRITNKINNQCYIGITNDYKKRWANHKCNCNKSCIGYAIQKYGLENFNFEILFSGVSIEEIDALEIEQIKKHNSLAPNGYNIAKGGNYMLDSIVGKEGNENGNAHLSYDEAKYIKDHRNEPAYVLYDLYSEKLTYNAFLKIYHNQTYKNIEPTVDEYANNVSFSAQFVHADLTYAQVCEIRELYMQGVYWKEVYKIYKEYYPSAEGFWNVYCGNRYSLVMPEVFTKERRQYHASLGKSGSRNGRAKLTEQQVREIRLLHAEGRENSEIYKLYPDVSHNSIRDIINKKTWKNVL